MKTAQLKQKLHQYIETAGDKKLNTIYTMVEDDIEEYNHWDDKTFVAEMNRRMNELETGKVKGCTWEEVKKRAVKKLQSAKAGK